jgi:urease accessory protein
MNLQDLAPSQTGWEARLQLAYAVTNDGTRITTRRHVGPLVVQKAFYPEGPAVCHSVVLHPPGGIAGGDRLDIEVDAGEHSKALLTTPGAGKWYRSAGTAAVQRVNLAIRPDASIEWLPQENIVFDGALAYLHLSVNLGSASRYIGWDITCLGRTASEERFTKGCVRNRTEIRQEGRRLWGDYAFITGGGRLLESAVGLAGFPVMGTLLAAGFSPDRDLVDACRAVEPQLPARVGVTALPNLLVARYLGASTERARSYFVALWRLIRPAAIGRTACIPRIWST